MAEGGDFLLLQRQAVARGDLDLDANEVEAGNHLSHGVLDLQAGVHFEEEVAAIGAEDELDGSCVPVARRRGEPHRRLADAVAKIRGQVRRRRFLDDLLKTALHRAFAFEQMDRGAFAVAKDLHFDVAGTLDIELGIDAPVAEIALSLARGDARGLGELACRANNAHSLAAAARRRLDEDGEADRLGGGDEGRHVARWHDRRRHRHAMRLGEISRGNLVAHQFDRPGVGADEVNPAAATAAAKRAFSERNP